MAGLDLLRWPGCSGNSTTDGVNGSEAATTSDVRAGLIPHRGARSPDSISHCVRPNDRAPCNPTAALGRRAVDAGQQTIGLDEVLCTTAIQQVQQLDNYAALQLAERTGAQICRRLCRRRAVPADLGVVRGERTSAAMTSLVTG